MFAKIQNTSHAPARALLVWDGDCSFCKFWKTRWEQKTAAVLGFETYQHAAQRFPDIPLKEFKKASRLIDESGTVYSGPDSAYRSLYLGGTTFWHNLYHSQNWFTWLSDHGYNHIAKNRSFYWKVTKVLFGKENGTLKKYWLGYLLVLSIVIGLLVFAV